MNKRLYVAYGSNLNFKQMRFRCPTAKLYGIGVIDGYVLQFKGRPHNAFATITPKEGASVPAAVWEIRPADEWALDRYEGYPTHYTKRTVPVRLDGTEVNAMVYIMDPRAAFGLPSPYYYQTVHEGYNNCELDTDVLDQAVEDSAWRYYAATFGQGMQQTMFDYKDEDESESNAFSFSDEMQL